MPLTLPKAIFFDLEGVIIPEYAEAEEGRHEWEVKKLIETLHADGVPCGIASPMTREGVLSWLNDYHFNADKFILSCLEPQADYTQIRVKPFPDLLLKACETAKVRPKDVWYVGDHADIDGIFAWFAGCQYLNLSSKASAEIRGEEIWSSMNSLHKESIRKRLLKGMPGWTEDTIIAELTGKTGVNVPDFAAIATLYSDLKRRSRIKNDSPGSGKVIRS